MFDNITCGSLVPGVSVTSIFRQTNPALKSDYKHHFIDAWLELFVETDSTIQFYPKEATWRTCFVCQTSTEPLHLQSTKGTSFFILDFEDTLDDITVSEEHLRNGQNDIFGLWLNVFYQRNDKQIRTANLLFPLAGYGQTGATRQ